MNGRIVTLGEIMLRLKPPGFERFFQSPLLDTTYGGSEANVALSLAHFGLETRFVTALPQNPIAEACIRFLRGYGVDTGHIARQGQRMGTYYLEVGASQRPSQVVYDRAHSSISTAKIEDFDWLTIFGDASWFHISGITPALSQSAAELSIQATRTAKEMGLTVSCDYNYRDQLWDYGKNAPEIMAELVQYVDVGIGNEGNCYHSLGVRVDDGEQDKPEEPGSVDLKRTQALAEKMFATFPNLKLQAITLRRSFSASHNGWSACLYDGREFFASRHYEISHIVDRVGGGDSFAADLIYGLISDMDRAEALEFATAASCLKLSISGDANLVTVNEVKQLLGSDTSGRVGY